MGRGLPIEVIASNYRQIVERIQSGSPKTTLYIQSVLPMNEAMLKADYLKNKRDSIIKLNEAIQQLAQEKKVKFINLHPVFADAQGELKEVFTMDGIHLRPAAYVEWVAFLKKQKYL